MSQTNKLSEETYEALLNYNVIETEEDDNIYLITEDEVIQNLENKIDNLSEELLRIVALEKTSQQILDDINSEIVYTFSDNVLETILNQSVSLTGNSSTCKTKYFGKFIPKHNGCVKVKCNGRTSNSSYYLYLIILTLSEPLYYSQSAHGHYGTMYDYKIAPMIKYNSLTFLSESSERYDNFIKVNPCAEITNTSDTTAEILVQTQKGVPLYFIGFCSNSSYSITFNSIQACADEVKI